MTAPARWRKVVLFLMLMIGLNTPRDARAESSSCPKKCSCSNRVVKCQRRQLTSVPTGIPPDTNQLYLDHNYITDIPAGSFRQLSNLTLLSLKSNKIVNVHEGALQGLDRLDRLFLQTNQLKELPPRVIKDVPRIRYLYLTNNKFKKIPNLIHCKLLIKFSIDANLLESAFFPEGFSQMNGLKSITVSNNVNIKKITIGDFKYLSNSSEAVTWFHLSRCGLVDIAGGAFANFTSMNSLVLSYNPLPEKVVQQVLADISHVKTKHIDLLDLSGVFKVEILDAKTFLPLQNISLKELRLSRNSIVVLQNNTFSPLAGIEYLNFQYSGIAVIQKGAFRGIKGLTHITLAYNKLIELPQDLPETLTILDVSNNQGIITIQKEFYGLTELMNLDLKRCSVRVINKDAFVSLGKLAHLDLSHNQLAGSSIGTKVLEPLSMLSTLDLSYNKMSMIKTESKLFVGLSSLAFLDMSNNLCNYLPNDIFSPLKNLTRLDLRKNQLGPCLASDYSGSFFRVLTLVEEIFLSDNNIQSLPPLLFRNMKSVKSIDLSNNQLKQFGSSLFNGTRALTDLSMASNQISLIRQECAPQIQHVKRWNLSGNPFACTCDLRWFRRWINRTHIHFLDLPKYQCNSPKELQGKPLLQFDPDSLICWHFPWYYAVAIAAGSSIILMSFVSAQLYRKRFWIRYRLHKMKKRKQHGEDREPIMENDFEADAFISCTENPGPDRSWIEEQLLPRLDVGDEAAGGGERYKFIYPQRDFLLGKPAVTETFESIENSRLLILVVSRDYLRDPLCNFVLKVLAHEKATQSPDGRNSVILITMNADVEVRMPKTYHSFIADGHHLEWRDDPDVQRVFWQRMEERLAFPGHGVV